MLRVQPRPRPAQVYTLDDLPQEPVALGFIPILGHMWGGGAPLDEARPLPPARPLSPTSEAAVQEELEGMFTWGRETKIRELIDELSNQANPQLQEAFAAWIAQQEGNAAGSNREEDLSVTLHAIRFIRKALLATEDLVMKGKLLALDEKCIAIFQMLLPKGRIVEDFLQQCEIALQDDKVFQEKVTMALLAERMQRAMLPVAAGAMFESIEEECDIIRQRLSDLQNARRAAQQVARADVEALARDVDRVAQEMVTNAEQMAEQGRQDAADCLRLNAILEECSNEIQRLL
jgi:hypothetical protein